MKLTFKLLVGLVAALTCACSGSNLPKYGLVSKLRILALQASAPEVSPGDPVPAVQSLVEDPDGGGRPISYSWVGCTEQISADVTRDTCATAPDRVSFGTGTSSNPGGATIPAAFLALVPSNAAYNGLNYIVALTVTAGTETVTGFKRIVVSSPGKTKNSNPTIPGFYRDGVLMNNGDPVGASPATLSVPLPASDYETYSYYNANGDLLTATEDMLITWFFTEGTVPTSRTFGGVLQNTWTPPSPKARTTVTLSVVVHDGRGGAAWQTVNLQ